MQQTTLRVLNFVLIFTLALLTVYFTLENTASTTINIIPGVSGSIPIAALVIFSSGLGACGVWFFAFWSDKVGMNQINKTNEAKEALLDDTFNRLQDLEILVSELRSAQKKVVPVISLSDDESMDGKEVA